MSASSALPYTLFLILLELAVGGILVLQVVDLRGQATRGFIKATTVMLPVILGLAFWVAFTLGGDVGRGLSRRFGTASRADLVAGRGDSAERVA